MLKKFVAMLSVAGMLMVAGCSNGDEMVVYKDGKVAAEVVAGAESALEIYDASRDVLEEAAAMIGVPKKYVDVVEYAVENDETLEFDYDNKVVTVVPGLDGNSASLYVE